MEHGPDMNRISSTVFAWRKGVLTMEEAKRKFAWLMDSDNFVPEAEQNPEPMPSDVSMQHELIQRMEHKLNIVIKQVGIRMPDELNPAVLGADVQELARENRKIEAIHLHRRRTGAGLAEAKAVIEEFIHRGTH